MKAEERFKTYLFVGMGLIGGSIARAIRRVQPKAVITGYARNRDKLKKALDDKVVDRLCDDFKTEAAKADLIFLCAPTLANMKNLEELAPYISENTLVSDVGSVKGDIQSCAEKLGIEAHFLGGHPMTGKEKSGYESADPAILENAYYIITPSEKTAKEDLEAFTDLVKKIRSIPLITDPAYHDHAVAAISHVPHLIASTLVNTVKNADNEAGFMKTIAAGGFKDITRIASSDPDMWESICRSNTEEIRKILKLYISGLEEVDGILKRGDFSGINRMFAESGEYRSGMADRRGTRMYKEYKLYIDIPDETGQIAKVAGILAEEGVNIKNIGITHNREMAEGALYIAFDREEDMLRSLPLLTENGYNIVSKTV
ncbi:MAG: prephenate dehydrogenase [Lachnospiraceae bacterium]|nr:prephenate dehydrogenase [Lachnospiraceae bacterium]